MTINKTSILIGTVLCAVLSTPAYAGGQYDQPKAEKLISQKSVSALIMSPSMENPISEKKQLEYLNQGLPKSLLAHDKYFEKENLFEIDFPKPNSQENIKLDVLSVKELAQSEAIRRLCFPQDPGINTSTKSFSVAPILAFLAPKLIGLFVKEVDKGLEKEISEYSAVHSQKVSIRPYAASGNFKLESNCFRYSRFTESVYALDKNAKISKAESKRELEFDLIAQWRLIGGQQIRIRPLRLYIASPAVPKDSDKLNIAISAETKAVWRSGNEGKSGDVFNSIILKDEYFKPEGETEIRTNGLKFYNLIEHRTKDEKHKNENGEYNTRSVPVYYKDTKIPIMQIMKKPNSNKAWSKFEPLPIIPYSDEPLGYLSTASLKISVAEVGDGARKKVLKLARKGLGIFKDDITSVLEEAAKGLLENEAPVIDTIEKYCATFSATVDEDGNLSGGAEWTEGNQTCDSTTAP
ncbi:hypothetical protein [Litorimonas sp. WD9-15]|uniref:hypothetical protein n=1 Tax=Litorimonas sp. WD9-15 TaxID=3418716 RepID=UPI003D024485